MKCHYIKVRGLGKVLIPGCMAVANSGRIEDCTCLDILTEADFERKRYHDVVARMRKEIQEHREENEMLRKGYIKILDQ